MDLGTKSRRVLLLLLFIKFNCTLIVLTFFSLILLSYQRCASFFNLEDYPQKKSNCVIHTYKSLLGKPGCRGRTHMCRARQCLHWHHNDQSDLKPDSSQNVSRTSTIQCEFIITLSTKHMRWTELQIYFYKKCPVRVFESNPMASEDACWSTLQQFRQTCCLGIESFDFSLFLNLCSCNSLKHS